MEAHTEHGADSAAASVAAPLVSKAASDVASAVVEPQQPQSIRPLVAAVPGWAQTQMDDSSTHVGDAFVSEDASGAELPSLATAATVGADVVAAEAAAATNKPQATTPQDASSAEQAMTQHRQEDEWHSPASAAEVFSELAVPSSSASAAPTPAASSAPSMAPQPKQPRVPRPASARPVRPPTATVAVNASAAAAAPASATSSRPASSNERPISPFSPSSMPSSRPQSAHPQRQQQRPKSPGGSEVAMVQPTASSRRAWSPEPTVQSSAKNFRVPVLLLPDTSAGATEVATVATAVSASTPSGTALFEAIARALPCPVPTTTRGLRVEDLVDEPAAGPAVASSHHRPASASHTRAAQLYGFGSGTPRDSQFDRSTVAAADPSSLPPRPHTAYQPNSFAAHMAAKREAAAAAAASSSRPTSARGAGFVAHGSSSSRPGTATRSRPSSSRPQQTQQRGGGAVPLTDEAMLAELAAAFASAGGFTVSTASRSRPSSSSAAKRAWSVHSKIVQPTAAGFGVAGSALMVNSPGAASFATKTAHHSVSFGLDHLRALYADPSPVEVLDATSPTAGAFWSVVDPAASLADETIFANLGAAGAGVVARAGSAVSDSARPLRPSTAHAHSSMHRPQRSLGDGGASLSPRQQRPRSAVTSAASAASGHTGSSGVGAPRSPPRISRAFGSSTPGAPPADLLRSGTGRRGSLGAATTKELLSSDATTGLWRGSPAARIANIYSRESMQTEADFEAAVVAAASARASRRTSAERAAAFAQSNPYAAHLGVTAAQMESSPAARGMRRDILTGEEKPLPLDEALAAFVPVRDDEFDSGADDDATATTVSSPRLRPEAPVASSVLIAGAGGLFGHAVDRPPVRVVQENSIAGSSAGRPKSALAIKSTPHGPSVVADQDAEAWKTYRDYSLRDASVIPPPPLSSSGSAPNASGASVSATATIAAPLQVHYPPSFVPAPLVDVAAAPPSASPSPVGARPSSSSSSPSPPPSTLPFTPSSISAFVDNLPSMRALRASVTLTNVFAGIGAEGPVRPLTSMPPTHHKSSKRRAAERVNAERKVQLEHARELVRLTNAVHPPADPEFRAHDGSGAGDGAGDAGAGATAPGPEGGPSPDVGDDAKKDAAPLPTMSSAASRAAERRRVKGLLYQSNAFRALLQDAQPGRVAPKRPASAVSVLRRSELSATSTSATTLATFDASPAEHVPLIGRSAGGAQSSGLAAELSRSQKGMAARRALAQRKADILAANRAATRAEFVDAAAQRAREIEELRTGGGRDSSGGGESGSNLPSATHSRSASMSTSFNLLGTVAGSSPRPPPSSARRPASASSASSRGAQGGKQAYFGRRDAALVHAQRAAEMEALAMAQAQAAEVQTSGQAQAEEETHIDTTATGEQAGYGEQPRETTSEEQQLMEALLQQQQPTVPDVAADAGSHEEKEQYPYPFNQVSSVAPSPPLSVAAVVQQSFGPNSTRSSRLRFLASSSRAAGVLSPGHGGVPPRAYAQNVVAAVRLANAPGRHPRSAGMGFGLDEPVMMLAFEPNQWTKQPLEQLTLHTGPRHETLAAAMTAAEAAAAAAASSQSDSSVTAGGEPHKGNLRSLRAEREAQAAVVAPAVLGDGPVAGGGMNSADETHYAPSSPMSSAELDRCLSPRINHAFFPMRGASLSAGKNRTDAGSHSERRGDGHSSQEPFSSRSGTGTGGRKTTGELAAAGTRDSYAAPGGGASTTASSSSSSSSASYAVVRALRPVSFNATRPDVLRALPHHPEESRLFGNMWTPSSIITSADNLVSKYAGGPRAP